MTERHTHGRAELWEHYTGSRLPDGGPYAERYDSDPPVSDRLYQGGGYMYPAHNYTYGLSRTQLRPAGPFPDEGLSRPAVKRARRRTRPVPVQPWIEVTEPHAYQVVEPFIPAYEVKRRKRPRSVPVSRNDFSVETMLGNLLESQ